MRSRLRLDDPAAYRSRERLDGPDYAPALVGFASFLAGLLLYLPPTTFPFDYHNDEPAKVEQVQLGVRTFKHPTLMVDVASVAAHLRGVASDPQIVAETGRALSGLYMAGAAGCVSAAVACSSSSWAGLAAGLLALATPAFFECSQYFKEDALHLFTLSLLGLCAAGWLRAGDRTASSLRHPLLCGIALGLAISTRYYTLALVPAVATLAFLAPGCGRHPWRRVAATLFPAIALAGLLHIPWLLKGVQAKEEIGLELFHLSHGHYGVGVPAPHDLYLRYLTKNLPWLAVLPIIGGMAAAILYGRPFYLCLAALSAAYFTAISFSPKYSDRYALPLTLALVAGTGVGLNALGRSARRLGPLAAIATATCLLAEQGARTLERKRGFERDDRSSLAEWIMRNLPESARFAEDAQALTARRLGSRVKVSAEFLPDAGSLEHLLDLGVTHVILCRDRHHRYTDLDQAEAARLDQNSAVRRERYLRFFLEGAPLWHSPCVDPKPLRPGLDLIALPSHPRSPRAGAAEIGIMPLLDANAALADSSASPKPNPAR